MVRILTSTSDRVRRGEYPIYMKDMDEVWAQHVRHILPFNVAVEINSGTPVSYTYEILIAGQAAGPATTSYAVYADPNDTTTNFPMKSRLKNFPGLVSSGRIEFVELERSETVDISGTKMRAYLAHGDRASFIAGLPMGIDGEAVWNIFRRRGTPQPIVMA